MIYLVGGSFTVEFVRKGPITSCTIIKTVRDVPYMGWIGAAYRNRADAEDSRVGEALSLYRAILAASGEVGAMITRNVYLRNLFMEGQAYAVSLRKEYENTY